MANPTVQISSSTAMSPLSPALRNTLYSALLSSNGIASIQSTLTHELQASGWTSNLRAYITQLLRSGECTSLPEVLDRVMAETQLSTPGASDNGTKTNGAAVNGVNGHGGKENGVVSSVEGKSVEEGGIRIPERAIREGVRAVRRELEAVCDIVVDDAEDTEN